MRIIQDDDVNQIAELDSRYPAYLRGSKLRSNLSLFRYRLVPTFGRDTIRRFASNASAMKKLAARDFEDLLQVSSPFAPL
jgi:hypothetical protein